MNYRPPPDPAVLTPAEVADLFRVTTKTVRRWARAGKLRSVLTPGGQEHRYSAQQVSDLLNGVMPK